MVFRGGLVFIGATKDERFRAFDKTTGDILWEYRMGAAGYSTPSIYEIEGRQYIVIAGGGGGKLQTPSGDSFYCFALPDRQLTKRGVLILDFREFDLLAQTAVMEVPTTNHEGKLLTRILLTKYVLIDSYI